MTDGAVYTIRTYHNITVVLGAIFAMYNDACSRVIDP